MNKMNILSKHILKPISSFILITLLCGCSSNNVFEFADKEYVGVKKQKYINEVNKDDFIDKMKDINNIEIKENKDFEYRFVTYVSASTGVLNVVNHCSYDCDNLILTNKTLLYTETINGYTRFINDDQIQYEDNNIYYIDKLENSYQKRSGDIDRFKQEFPSVNNIFNEETAPWLRTSTPENIEVKYYIDNDDTLLTCVEINNETLISTIYQFDLIKGSQYGEVNEPNVSTSISSLYLEYKDINIIPIDISKFKLL